MSNTPQGLFLVVLHLALTFRKQVYVFFKKQEESHAIYCIRL